MQGICTITSDYITYLIEQSLLKNFYSLERNSVQILAAWQRAVT